MTGYVRVDTSNNIADGNVINAADLDNEFDGVQAAFNASTGHTHGGGAGEGAPITALGPTQNVTVSTTVMAPKTTNTVDIGSSSLKFKDLYLAGGATLATITASGVITSTVSTGTAPFTVASTTKVSNLNVDQLDGADWAAPAAIGSGTPAAGSFTTLSASGTLSVTGVATLGAGAILNTPASVTLTNATGLPISTGVSGLGTGVATALAVNIGSAGAPVLFNGALGTPSSGTVTNLTGTASININGTVGATTPAAGSFTTLSASGVVTFSAGSASAPALTTSGDTNTGIFFPAADTVGITTGGTERARVDSSGNLGLGVTPSAWGSASRALQMQSGMSLFSNTSGLGGVGNNVYSNPGTGDYYIANGYATRYYQYNGTHVWNYAASGTAGNAISFTQAMTLDASGRLLVGLTSSIASNGIAQIGGNADTRLIVDGSSTQGIYFTKSGADNGTFRVDGSGNYNWFVKGAGTANMTLDSSGNLLVGVTTVPTGTTDGFAYDKASFLVKTSRNTTSSTAHYQFLNPNGGVGTISTSGSTTTYNTSSDYRLKHDVAPMTGALDRVAALKPVTYKWNADGSDGEGFIAHELQAVVPDCVTGEKDAVETYTDEEGNEQTRPVYQGIDTSFLVATLTAAIQELKAIVDAQAIEIAALKGQA